MVISLYSASQIHDMRHILISLFIFLVAMPAFTQKNELAPASERRKFEQLGVEIPDANVYRTASGAPGHEYWQQRADYDMKITIDDSNQKLFGDETVTYFNNSPDELRYIWMQLDQNVRALNSDSHKIRRSSMGDNTSFDDLKRLEPWFDGGFKINHVKDGSGKDLPYTINNTMMRIDLPTPLKPGGKFVFKVKWWYNINDHVE